MDDMKKMKSNHVKVVDRIQDQYKSVEDDIQVNHNGLYSCLLTNRTPCIRPNIKLKSLCCQDKLYGVR